MEQIYIELLNFELCFPIKFSMAVVILSGG